MNLGPRLRELRQRAGLTQPELADRAGVSVRAVREIESGRVAQPRPSSVDRIAAALGLSERDRAHLNISRDADRPAVAILGPLEVRPGQIGSAVQRTILSLLALHAGQPVTRDQIVDVVWGEDPPRTCLTQVQVAIGRLRDLFEPRRGRAPGSAIGSTPNGYRLCVDTDAVRFEELLAQDRTEEALDLWRGPVLAGSALRGHPAAVRLAQLRLDATLRSGQISRLRLLAADEPLHETLHARLMLALSASGDRASALQLYAELRKRLAEDLGVEPSAEVQQVYLSLLDDAARPVPVRPAQLPPDVGRFAGRDGLLQRLDDLLATGRVAVVSGTAGVGKTTLAVHWAYRVGDRFPDGQLYVNLRGFTPGVVPVEPRDALRYLLDALGVQGDGLPDDVDARSALYRSLLAERRLLVVLDDALDADQVRPLLPGAAGCFAVITSRSQLPGLVAAVGADPIALDVLTDAEAHALLVSRLGTPRVDAEPDAVAEIIALCARLPLTLALVAAQARLRPDLSLTALAAEVKEAGALDGFPGADIRAVFAASHRVLADDAALMFRLLGLHAGPDIGVAAAASLAGVRTPVARRLLSELARAHLVDEVRPGRFALHDLLRAYAAELAGDDREARRRLYDHYVHTANSGATMLNPYRPPLTLDPIADGATAVELVDEDAAMAWFQEEHSVLVATVEATVDGFGVHTGQLAAALTTFFDRRGHWSDWARTQLTAIGAARTTGDAAHAHRRLARAYTRMGRTSAAEAHLTAALELFGDDAFGVSNTHLDLAALLESQARYAEALEQALQALEISPDTSSQANAHNSVGWYYAQVGRRRDAFVHCEQALRLVQELGNRDGEAHAWDSVGYAYQGIGEDHLAATCYERALAIFRELGDRYYEAIVLTHLGSVNSDRAAYATALEILEDLDHPAAASVRTTLAEL